MKLAIFYHCLFFRGEPPQPLPAAADIVSSQMQAVTNSGLLNAVAEFHVGINGGSESEPLAKEIMPEKAAITFHGLQVRNELKTILMLEEWVKTHEGWFVLYFHSKGATHDPQSDYAKFSGSWREGMMQDLVANWRACVVDLDAGNDIACSHWMWNMADGTQHIPAGNFLWIKSDFARKLPSLWLRERIKTSGIDSVESRYESEVYWGNGPRPTVKQYRPSGGGGVP